MANVRAIPKIVSFPVPRPVRKRKQRRPVLLIALCVVMAYFTFVYISQALEMASLRRRETELELVRTALAARTAALQAEIELLNTPLHIEQLARQRLGLVKSEDKVFSPIIVNPRP